MEGTTAAITVRGAYKRYTPNAVILKGLNMTAPEATIYGLLGPSGCGKTTLLRCIVGRLKLDAGEINVKAGRRDNVGYMPQELGLYEYMTIDEAFHFYGCLYGLKLDVALARGTDLIKFLELPEGSRFIGTLSGGQQRRVSFAVSLIHDPDLLILDEPTVGIDPVLSKAIWERLIEMTVCQRKTIILTTHYIEEARQAHTIGLMRDGTLLAEQPPLQLMAMRNCNTLEQAFLELSQIHEAARSSEEIEKYPDSKNYQQKPTLIDKHKTWNTNRFLAQLLKNVVWFSRNIPSMLFLLSLPAIIALICQLVFASEPKNLNLAIVSDELVNGFQDCLSPPDYNCTHSSRPLSCRFLDYVRTYEIKHQEFEKLSIAKDAVRSGQAWGVLHFSKNYTTSVIDRLEYGRHTPDEIIDDSNIDIWMDMSNMWISTMLRRNLQKAILDTFGSLLSDCNYSSRIAAIPLKFEEAVYGLKEPSFMHYVAPGVICTFSFYLTVMYTTGAIMMEKSIGLERSLVAGMTKLEVVAAHVVVQTFVGLKQAAILLICCYGFYDNPMHGNIFLIALLLVFLEMMGLWYGLLLAIGFDSQRDATNAGIGTVNALFMVCGIMWPIQGMHWVLKSIVWAIPVQPAVETYRAIAERGWSITHPTVYMGFVSTFIWTIIFIVFSILLARKNKIGL
uniref:Uncharacterized protein n=1 Tax=Clastoptera arizonana TaxID=38151 RepID=A0A1B6CAU9_9HEMI